MLMVLFAKLLFLLSLPFRPAEAAATSSIEDSDSLLMSTTCSTALVPIAQGSQVKKLSFFDKLFFTFAIILSFQLERRDPAPTPTISCRRWRRRIQRRQS